jgi:YesN/AraC family two-component response regulator
LNTLRIEKSKEYLGAGSRMSIEEIGTKVGYQNIYNFSRWFKIVTGMSPSEWRKAQ